MPAEHLTLSGIDMPLTYEEVTTGGECEIMNQAHYSFTELDAPAFFKWIESATFLNYQVALRLYQGKHQTMLDIIAYRKKI